MRPSDGRFSGTYRIRQVLDETLLVYERGDCPECKLTLITTVDVSESRDGQLCIDYACASCGHKWRERHT